MESTDKVRLLVVDDDEMVRRFMEVVLKREGYDVSSAVDGTAGVALTRGFKPHLIVTDVAMPSMSGFEMCQRLRKDAATNQIPIIFVTGCVTPEDYRTGFSLGADDFLAKPLRAAELVARVQAALQRVGIRAPESAPQAASQQVGIRAPESPPQAAQPPPQALEPAHVLLAGRLSTATVPDLLQTLGFNTVSGTLVVRGEFEGRVDLRRGQLVRAEVKLPRRTLHGFKAWLRLASWTRGTFQLLDSRRDGAELAKNIDVPTASLLMESALHRDAVLSMRARFPPEGVQLRRGKLHATGDGDVEHAVLAAAEPVIRLDDLLDDLDFPDRELLHAVLKLLDAGALEAAPVEASREPSAG